MKDVNTPSSPSPAPPRAAAVPPSAARGRQRLADQISLPALLCFAALAEFLFYRLMQPLSRIFPHLLPAWLCSVVDFAGTYSLNLASVLALIVTAAMLVGTMAPGGLANDPVRRAGLSLMSLVFILVSALLILFPALAAQTLGLVRSQWLAQTSSVCLSLLVLLSVLPRRTARRRHKVALLFLLLPPLLLLETHWGLLSSRGILQRYTLFLAIYGTTAAAAALGASAALLWPAQTLRWRTDALALAGATLVVGSMGILLFQDRGAAARLIYIGFDMHLPASAAAQVIYLWSLAAWSLTTAALLVRPDRFRRRGIGLLLIGLSGGQARTIHQACFYLAGLLCLAEAMLDELPPRPST